MAQLIPAPEFWPSHKHAAIAKLFPGPRGWLSASVIRDPRLIGFLGGFPDLELWSLAARSGVARRLKKLAFMFDPLQGH